MRVGLVAHDAGGAEIIARAALEGELSVYWAAEGPAIDIFRRHLCREDERSLPDVIRKSEWILCGSSTDSDYEWHALLLARLADKPSVVFLEHWSNYGARFRRGDEIRLPDEIWVGDAHAEAIARAEFHDVPIVRRENPYLKALVKSITQPQVASTGDSGKRLLYVSEPIYGRNFTEHEAVAFLLHNVHRLFPGDQVTEITLRPHPRETLQTYEWTRAVFRDLDITIRAEGKLEDEIRVADAVVGVSTVAMVVALLAGRRVFSSIPPGGGCHSLPYADIAYVRDLRELLGNLQEDVSQRP